MADPGFTWREIRDLRARPPDLAAKDPDRREMFSAALQQAELFAEAAKGTGYATKPVFLYYALSQGQRAAAAAQLASDWDRVGHGLSFRPTPGSFLDGLVKPNLTKTDLYSSMVEIEESEPLPGPVSLRELLSINFELREIPIGLEELPRPLILHRMRPDPAPQPDDTGGGTLSLVAEGLKGTTRAALSEQLTAYPSLQGAEPVLFPSGARSNMLIMEKDEGGIAFRTSIGGRAWPVISCPITDSSEAGVKASFEKLAPDQIRNHDNLRVAQPGVGSGGWMLGAITAWWALLLGLSSLARYDPAIWRRALDVDSEPTAPFLERVIDQAEESIPFFLFQLLTGET